METKCLSVQKLRFIQGIFHKNIIEASQENPTRSDINRTVQSKKIVRGYKILTKEVEQLYYVAKTMVLISCAVTAQLICAFVFHICKKQVFS